MSLEIRELVVRASVNKQGAEDQEQGNSIDPNQLKTIKKAIASEVFEKVMDALMDRNRR